LYLAIKSNQQACAKLLIEKGAEVYFTHPVKTDASPIFNAIKCNNLKILEMICDTGVNLELCKNTQGSTPLVYASQLYHFEVINYLSIRNCNLNDSGSQDITPLKACLDKE